MSLRIGLDCGSTTVKAVVVAGEDSRLLWKDYKRHGTHVVETTLDFLERMEREAGLTQGRDHIYATGSGAGIIAPLIGAKPVQEVNAVAFAVDRLHPDVRFVTEIGGEDQKMIFFHRDGDQVRKSFTMQSACSGGTGTFIEKTARKLQIEPDQLCGMAYSGYSLHKISSKCGIFSEADANSLQKAGVPAEEIVASIFEAVVFQNLAVLTRGNTPYPKVLLLGGPNCFFRGLQEAWVHHLKKLWQERGIEDPSNGRAEDLVTIPDEGLYYAAQGAAEHGRGEENPAPYKGRVELLWFLKEGRKEIKSREGRKALVDNAQDLDTFRKEYARPPFVPVDFESGGEVRAAMGVDFGSTTAKAVLLSPEAEVLAKVYRLSKGNPIEDAKAVFRALQDAITSKGARLEVLSIGVTGYGKDLLNDVIGADAAVVETVAHAESCLHFYPDTDAICDVGGTDVKIMRVKNGAVTDFRLNSQCSSGNGAFLQGVADRYGVPLAEYADRAFQAERMPNLVMGCGVFLQSDIVNQQRKGWKAEEIMAALAGVLPQNVWVYAGQFQNMSLLGKKFVLQGGTHNNLAAVKAQVDFIRSKVPDASIVVHEYSGEAGAIGAALEALRVWEEKGKSRFIGFEAVETLTYESHTNTDTVCRFCTNFCQRTFIDVTSPASPGKPESKVPLAAGHARLIVNNSCEKGLTEDTTELKHIVKALNQRKGQYPNVSELAAEAVWKAPKVDRVDVPAPAWKVWNRNRAESRKAVLERRARMKVGIPRILNQWSCNPFFSGWLVSLGVTSANIVYSEVTSEELFREFGKGRGSVDPCWPSKCAVAHFGNLLYGTKHKLDVMFAPMIYSLPSFLAGHVQATRACPTVMATPEQAKAGFLREKDLFNEKGMILKKTLVNMDEPDLCARQLFDDWRDILGLTEEENGRAVEQGYRALKDFQDRMRRKSLEILRDCVQREQGCVLLLCRPYHQDPGIGHQLDEELQKLGFPILSSSYLPLDSELLEWLYASEVEVGRIKSPLDIGDVWAPSYSSNTNEKMWAAKFAARMPWVIGALELNSFNCGMDQPITTPISRVIEMSGSLFFRMGELDSNRPAGSIRIRMETMAHALRRYGPEIIRRKKARLPDATSGGFFRSCRPAERTSQRSCPQ